MRDGYGIAMAGSVKSYNAECIRSLSLDRCELLTSLVKQLLKQLGPGMAVTALHPSLLACPVLRRRRNVRPTALRLDYGWHNSTRRIVSDVFVSERLVLGMA